jgi:hypothetical protein
MKELTIQKILLLSSFLGGVLLKIDINELVNFVATYISIISFIVILVSNWYRFMKQLKYWFKSKK